MNTIPATLRVLIIEDRAQDIELIKDSLHEADRGSYVFEEAETLQEAIAMLATGVFDVILLDLGLPGCTGTEAVDHVASAVDEEVPIVVFSAREEVSIAREALNRGAQDFILKGLFYPETLARSIWYSIERKKSELERIRLQAEKAKLELRLQKAQKHESLAVLAGGVAHDFNNILVSILGHADLALLKLSDTAEGREQFEQIATAAERAGELAQQMLAYSGRGHVSVHKVNLNDLVANMLHIVKTSIAGSAVLNLDLSPQPCQIEADPTQIRQIILNLVLNASEALENRSGAIAISTRLIHCDEDYLTNLEAMGKLKQGLYSSLEVSDTGIGMSPETRERMFDPFYSTKFAGRGLGLAAALGIVKGHNGVLKVDSELGKGTSIKVLLPAIDADEAMEEKKTIQQYTGKGKTVLFIDDDESVRSVAKVALEHAGYKVLTANDGLMGLETLKQYNLGVDLIILDLNMPRLDGEQTFRELKTSYAAIPVLLISGFSESDTMSKFIGKGLAGFLAKPFSASQLIEKAALACA